MLSHLSVAVVVCLLLLAQICEAGSGPARKAPRPCLLGVDGCYIDKAALPDPWSHQPYIQVLRSLGAELYVVDFRPVNGKGADNGKLTAAQAARIDEFMRANHLKYTINNEFANWVERWEPTPGVNAFAQPNGAHRWDIPMDWLTPLLSPAKPGPPALLGITYDEVEHMLLTCHQFGHDSERKPLDFPNLVNTDGVPLDVAFDRLVAKCRSIRTSHYRGIVQPITEQVWPDLFHIFARAGWTVTPKLLKENLSSVIMSIALGAAIEYASDDTEFWVSPDLWFGGLYPGHSPRALRSALMMGYWLGADTVYVENLDFQDWAQRHPEADRKGSLIRLTESGEFELTPHGKVVQDFYTRYVPEHPRTIDWRDYHPRVAIVRLPDGAWGQKGTMFRDRLLGNREHPMDEISAEWLHVWPILTHGVARGGAISTNNGSVYPEPTREFFVPIDSVAVFDHLVTGSVLDSVECFVVCGHALSAETFKAIARRVASGATCVIARRLYDLHARGTMSGKWVVVDSFTDPVVSRALKPFLGPPDVARFRFSDCTVEFRPEKDRDVVGVKIAPLERS